MIIEKPPTDIDLGIYRHRGAALEPWDPRQHRGPWLCPITPKERRSRARAGTHGRRGARRVPAAEIRPGDSLPKVVREARLRVERAALNPIRRGHVAPQLEYRVLRRVEYGAGIQTDIRCACSPRCAAEGRHVVRLHAIVYTDDPDAALRLADAIAHPHISRLTAQVR